MISPRSNRWISYWPAKMAETDKKLADGIAPGDADTPRPLSDGRWAIGGYQPKSASPVSAPTALPPNQISSAHRKIEKRKIIQVSVADYLTTGFVIVALCNDGTLWIKKDHSKWIMVIDIPQPDKTETENP